MRATAIQKETRGAFRGITAAASLKLDLHARRGIDIERFPRHHRCGLIEAAGHNGQILCHLHAFRGITAAASLKLR